MADVAARAGVSMMTVSRMLRQPERVSPATREKIETAMNELGYVPNLVAGGLAATQTQTVAAIVPYIQHGVFADAIQGLSDTLIENGYCVLLGNSGGSGPGESMIVRTLLGHRPAGVVLQGGDRIEEVRLLLQRARIPVVEMGTIPSDPIDMYVGYSNVDAARAMTEHLLKNGRRRIGFVTADPSTNDRHAAREAGFRAALSAWKIDHDPALTVVTQFGIAEGRAALDTLLSRCPDLDAVCCASDLWAAGAIYECQRRGLRVPEKIAISGFNDQEFAAEMIPAITTIRVRRYEIGAIAAKLILARLAGQAVDCAVDVGFDLCLRESA